MNIQILDDERLNAEQIEEYLSIANDYQSDVVVYPTSASEWAILWQIIRYYNGWVTRDTTARMEHSKFEDNAINIDYPSKATGWCDTSWYMEDSDRYKNALFFAFPEIFGKDAANNLIPSESIDAMF